MREILEEFTTEVKRTDTSYIVNYTKGDYSGYSQYRLVETKGLIKPIKQRFFIYENSNMGDVIEYIHQRVGLSNEDIEEVNKLIKDHPLEVLDPYRLSDNNVHSVKELTWGTSKEESNQEE
jgi:hypothetical protein